MSTSDKSAETVLKLHSERIGHQREENVPRSIVT